MNDGKQFELEVQQLLQQMGLDAEITGYSQDGGIDLTAINRSPVSGGRYIVQCKDWAAPVGEPAIRDLYGTVHSEGASKGILITTSTFTAAALRFAQGKPLELIDGVQYHSLCEQYGISPGVPPPLPAANDVFQPGATTVRVTSVDCTDPKERAAFRKYLFSVGTLNIGNNLSYIAPGTGGFVYPSYRVERAHSETSLTGCLELTFVVEDIVPDPDPPTYHMTFEGRSELIRTLYQAASAQIRLRGEADHSKSGCLTMSTLLVGVAILAWLLCNF